jgi:hypothetical protein
MLVEVIDERPAADSTELTTGDEDDVLEQLVSHYAQPIHVASNTPHSQPYFAHSGTIPNRAPPAVLKFCFEQLIQSEDVDEDINTKKRKCTIRNLLALYPARIHSILFDDQQRTTTNLTGIAVLYHYEWLISLLYETFSHSSDERVSTGVDTHGSNEERQWNEKIMETVQCLLQDLTASIPQVVGAFEDTTKETKNRIFLCKKYVIPCLLRLLQKSFQNYCSQNEHLLMQKHGDLTRQVVIRLLSWTIPQTSPSIVAPSLVDAFTYRCLSTTPDTYAPRQRDDTQPIVWNGLDWNQVMAITNEEWYTNEASEAAAQCLDLVCGASNGDDNRKQACEKLGWLDMSKSIRAHFFGKNDFSEPVGAVVPQRTRLHLGRTVMEEPVEYDKPYVTVPTRLYSFYVFTSLLPQVSPDMIASLVPILYELLAAPQESIQGMAAACLYQLLHISQESKFVWSPAILSNLLTAVNLAMQTCRKGAVVSMLGVTQATLLGRLSSHEDVQQRRRKASQQWLMILHKNIQNMELVWGVLAGALIRLGRDHVLTEANDALELGRLVLSCHLPLIRQEDGTATMSADGLGSEIILLALLSLCHWLVAAHAVMVHHEGKILGSLLMCQCRAPSTSATYVWSRHLSAMLVIMSDSSTCTFGEKVSEKLTGIIDSREYKDKLITAAKEVLEEAERLKERLLSAS